MNLINIYTTLEVADENSSLEKNEVYPNKNSQNLYHFIVQVIIIIIALKNKALL